MDGVFVRSRLRIVHRPGMVDVGGRGEFYGRSAHRRDGGAWDTITPPYWLGIIWVEVAEELTRRM